MGTKTIWHLRNRYFLLIDLVLVPLAVLIAYALRLDGFDRTGYQEGWLIFTALAMVLTPLIFAWAGIYSRFWRYASIEELQLLVGTVTSTVLLTTALTWALLALLPGQQVLPRSIPFLVLLLLLPMTATPRLILRILAGYPARLQGTATTRALVMGAGDAGVLIARELKRNPAIGTDVVGFLDDDPRKRGMRIHGVPVLGSRYDIPTIVEAQAIDQVIIAMPTAPGKTIRAIVEVCELAKVHTKIIPGIYELLDGSVSVKQLRDIQIEDLLRREPVRTDTAAVAELIRGKCVLVTGGGGSIGSELCRQVLRGQPAKLVVLGHGENSVFGIYHELLRLQGAEGRTRATPTAIVPVIADIRFADRLRAVFAEHQPAIVFHAAAHKHVPLMELNPSEAITNNVLGTKHLLDAALATGVTQFVMVSTDKAVNPTNIMGASKRVAELLVHRVARQSGRAFVAVRFGNVLGSRGSVVPTFQAQIAAGGPVTVTHQEMVRYFMTIPEAVQLVLQAATLGRGGEVFVLDMGEPVKIVDLARDLIELSGLEVGRDIDIVFTGLRPGEKLYEELFVPGESYGRTKHQQIFIAGNADRFVPLRLDQAVTALVAAANQQDAAGIVAGLHQLVPEFQPLNTPPRHDERQAEPG